MSDTLSEAAPQAGFQTFRLVDAQTVAPTGEGCGCGGHGASGGGCGCGGHGHAHRHAGASSDAPASSLPAEVAVDAEAGELDVHAIPRVVRRSVLLHAMDVLPVGEGIVVKTPHQPEPLFDHLRDSEAHYRVETLEAGPSQWRYRITRLS